MVHVMKLSPPYVFSGRRQDMLLEKPAHLSFVTEEVIDAWHSGHISSKGRKKWSPFFNGHCFPWENDDKIINGHFILIR